jgi:hypothetical protein
MTAAIATVIVSTTRATGTMIPATDVTVAIARAARSIGMSKYCAPPHVESGD